jgi:hypothetical protein
LEPLHPRYLGWMILLECHESPASEVRFLRILATNSSYSDEVPVRIRVRDFPHHPYGNRFRRSLAARVWGRGEKGSVGVPTEHINNILNSIVQNILNHDQINRKSTDLC